MVTGYEGKKGTAGRPEDFCLYYSRPGDEAEAFIESPVHRVWVMSTFVWK